MISFNSSRFGRLEVAKDRVIHFPGGLMGFPDIKRFILMDYKDTSLKWLQAVDDPDIAFIVMPPYEVFPDYSLKIDKSIYNLLALESEDDLVIFVMLRVEGGRVTANLQGPLVLNSINKRGVQIVNEDPRFSCRTPLKSLNAPAAK
ncbi:MAG TPA: flagellar assembly protein FliW [Nitrospirae bacterium]|nr:flagellar assembly factor FliW [bacterium BMS3Abin06]HDH13243.1 flagellar assembly protein FliW [Nitrospirota bacterium]HDZ01789.1 flagellar assembly protein FliW [Nitrospirota bacterium]